MSSINKKPKDRRVDYDAKRLAGGYGPRPAKQDSEALLRRAVMACLLWEDIAYQDGTSVVDNIAKLVPQVEPSTVFNIAVDAALKQKLRHVPLLIAREMARYDTHKHLVGDLLPIIITRVDSIMEFVAIYWHDGKQPLSAQVKKGLAASFAKFDEYQFAKYNRNKEVKLRDVMFLVHPRPPQGKEELYRRIAENELETPDTWEVALSSGASKKDTWTRLIKEKKIGALAFLRNLRNMSDAGVDRKVIIDGFNTINPRWLLPTNYVAALKNAPKWARHIYALLVRASKDLNKLPGHTMLIVDVSGSMWTVLSRGSTITRLDLAMGMITIVSELAEDVSIYLTAGSDYQRRHATKEIAPLPGFILSPTSKRMAAGLGGGGIFTRQCLEWIKGQVGDFVPDRIIVVSDSQDCDYPYRRIPAPFGKYNYIVDVSVHNHGIAYDGVWDAEISGWSDHFIDFIAEYERGQEVT